MVIQGILAVFLGMFAKRHLFKPAVYQDDLLLSVRLLNVSQLLV